MDLLDSDEQHGSLMCLLVYFLRTLGENAVKILPHCCQIRLKISTWLVTDGLRCEECLLLGNCIICQRNRFVKVPQLKTLFRDLFTRRMVFVWFPIFVDSIVIVTDLNKN